LGSSKTIKETKELKEKVLEMTSESMGLNTESTKDLSNHIDKFTPCLKELQNNHYAYDSNIVENFRTLVTLDKHFLNPKVANNERYEYLNSISNDILSNPTCIRVNGIIQKINEEITRVHEKFNPYIELNRENQYMQNNGIPYIKSFENSFEFGEVTHKFSKLLDHLEISEIMMLSEFVNKLPEVSLPLLTPSLLFILSKKAVYQLCITFYDTNVSMDLRYCRVQGWLCTVHTQCWALLPAHLGKENSHTNQIL